MANENNSSVSIKGASPNDLNESSAIRNLNQVGFTFVGGGEKHVAFQAYMTSNISFSFISNLIDFNLQGNASVVTTAFSNLMGVVPAFDMPRWYGYKGSEPLRFNIDCYLKLRTNPTKDLFEPIQTLVDWILPSRSKESIFTNIDLKPVADTLKGKMSILSEFINKVSSSVKDIYMLDIPKQIKPELSGDKAMTLHFGRLDGDDSIWVINIKEVFIREVRFDWGKLIVGKGMPERINMTISVETLRKATNQLMSAFLTTQDNKSNQNNS